MRRSTHTGISHAQAECFAPGCNFKVYTRNSLGLAARHADAHPDHEVIAEQGLTVIYNKHNEKGS